MKIWRTFLVIVVSGACAAALTGWILNGRHTQNMRQPTYYPSLGDRIEPIGDTAGAAPVPQLIATTNPLSNNSAAIASGRKLFLSMNCAGCHGYDAKGNMGPNLRDTYWRYGGAPEQIYQSIRDGRPQGMPAWGLALPRQSIWELVAYIQSLGGSVPARDAQAELEGDDSDRGQGKGANDQQ